jgi:arginine deiminase
VAGPRIGSETGALRRAVVHTPGAELSHISPRNQSEFGFNDLLYERYARREHETLVALLRDVFGVEILQVRALLEEALARTNSMDRLRLLQTVSEVERLDEREQERLLGLAHTESAEDGAALAALLIAGEPVRSDGSVREFLNTRTYHLPPIPNLMLTRDLGAVIGDAMFVAWNAAPVRRRESLLWRFILQHSSLHGALRWKNWMVDDVPMPASPLYALEGGNVVQPGERVIVVGQSARTGPDAVEKLTGWLGENAEAETHLFIADLPDAIEHLDTVFTMLSRDECLVFPPSVFANGPESLDVLHAILRPGREPELRRPPGLLEPLGEALGVELRAVSCGGPNPLEQRRERWWGGACVLAVEPGRLIAFRSAQRTLAELEARGYVCLDCEEVLSGRRDPRGYERCVILVRGSELSRARGGPRSFVLPLERDRLGEP